MRPRLEKELSMNELCVSISCVMVFSLIMQIVRLFRCYRIFIAVLNLS
jgi:hypothetical protein